MIDTARLKKSVFNTKMTDTEALNTRPKTCVYAATPASDQPYTAMYARTMATAQLSAASVMVAKIPASARGSTCVATGSMPCRKRTSKRPRRRISARAAPFGMVHRSATNSAAVRGINSSTSTRITIS